MLALPASSFATITEVGALPTSTPPTVPSCTAGPIGSVGREAEKAAEAEKKAAEKKAAEKKAAEKKASGKKGASGHRASTHGRHRASKASVPRSGARRHARAALFLRDGGLQAAGPLLSAARVASTSTTSQETTQPTEAKTTEPALEAPCLAVSRTTGFQVQVGSVRNPLVIPRNGRIVAWTIQLGRPTPAQIKFFDENEGGAASAGIAILYPQKKPKLTYHLLAQTQLVKLEPYFGMSVQFPLANTIKVKKGDVVALTVPTWAPALALGFKKTTSWRASRQKSQCSTTTTQTAQTELKSNFQYSCLYLTARLTYSATLISSP